MARQTATFDVSVTALLEANMVRFDYGVPGSPVEYEPEDIKFADLSIEIEGVSVLLADLPKELRDVLLGLAQGQSEEGEWK